MRLLVNATILLKDPRGLGVYTKNVLDHWSSSNMDTDILISKEGQKLVSNSALHFIKAPLIRRHLLRIAWLQKLGWQGSLRAYDAVLSTGIEFPSAIKLPYFITVHDLIALRYPQFVSRKYHLYFKWILPQILRKARGVITISESTKQDLLFYYPELAADNICCST